MTPRRPRRRTRRARPDAGPLPVAVAVSGVALAAYLLLAAGVPDDRPATRPADGCVDRVVHHAARLRDC